VTETEVTLGGTVQDWELPVYETVVVVAKEDSVKSPKTKIIADKADKTER
jgi:hypothetical protein